MLKTVSLLQAEGYELEKAFDYQKHWIALYEVIAMLLIKKPLRELTINDRYQIRQGLTMEQFEVLRQEHGEELGAIYEEVNPVGDLMSLETRLNHLLETVNIHIYQLDSGRFVLQLDYTTTIGSKWNVISKNARGIVYDLDTLEVLSLPFHKFFNVNEREEVRLENLDLNEPGYVMEKLDGTMIHVFLDEDTLYFATRGRVSKSMHNESASQQFLAQDGDVDRLKIWIREGYTPIFEFLLEKGHEYQHVVNYEKREIRLIAIRHRSTGAYVSPDLLDGIAKELNVKASSFYSNKTFFNITGEALHASNFEGWVVVFSSGLFIKVKAREYMAAMEIGIVENEFDRDAVSLRKLVLNWMELDIQDDKIAQLPTNEMRDEATKAVDEIWEAIRMMKADLQVTVDTYSNESPKEFARIINERKDIDKAKKPIIFALRNKNEIKLKKLPPHLLKEYLA